MVTETSRSIPTITVGSGNIEYILEHDGEIELGKKHIINSYELIGGSCVNYSLRLLTTGNVVFPVPLIGEDHGGRKIRDELHKAGTKTGLNEDAKQFLKSEGFFIPGVRTPKATVLVHKERRTILSEVFKGTQTTEIHLHKRFQLLDELITDPQGSVMIGHITLDGDPDKPGSITKRIISSFGDKFLVFANFGNSQLQHGINFWEKDLRQIDLLQLNLEEIRQLFKDRDKKASLYEILEWLRQHSITAVITLSRFGAIGTYKNGKNGITLAWPLDIGKIVDPTGAGDAFAAGMVSSLKGNRSFSFDDFKAAINTGRLWASLACTTIGASGYCPTKHILAEFASKHTTPAEDDIEVTNSVSTERILNLFDKAYQ